MYIYFWELLIILQTKSVIGWRCWLQHRTARCICLGMMSSALSSVSGSETRMPFSFRQQHGPNNRQAINSARQIFRHNLDRIECNGLVMVWVEEGRRHVRRSSNGPVNALFMRGSNWRNSWIHSHKHSWTDWYQTDSLSEWLQGPHK